MHNMANKIDLTAYDYSATRQLLNWNPKIAKMLPTASNEQIIKHINDNYILTQEQLDYYISHI